MSGGGRVLRAWQSTVSWLVRWSLISILWRTVSVKGQQNLLQDPALTTFELSPSSSATFHLEPPTNSSDPKRNNYFVTLNVCNAPDSVTLADLESYAATPALFAFNSSSQTSDDIAKAQSAVIKNGFGNLTLSHAQSNDQGVWITVNAPESSGGANALWSYQLGVSTVAPMHVIDRFPYFQFGDSDNATALFTSPTYFPTLEDYPRTFLVMLPISQNTIQQGLLNSVCYLSSNRDQIRQTSVNTSATNRGVFTRTAAEGAIGQERVKAEAGGERTQYLVSDLEAGSNYSVVGLQYTGQEADQDAQSESAQSTRLYQSQYFTTKTSSNCRLVTDFDICPSVAYSVPSPPELPTADLLGVYTSLLTPQLAAFNTTLYTFPCGMKEQGDFSSVRTCGDCYDAYRRWLCTIMIPQCADIPAELEQSAQTNYTVDSKSQIVFSNQPVPAEVQNLLIRTNPALSRTPEFSTDALANNTNLTAFNPTSPFPYAEVPPCLSLCTNVAASCPYLISWNCPLKSQTLAASYGLSQKIPESAYQGGNEGKLSPNGRSADRWGNRFCNAAQVDVQLDVRSALGTSGTFRHHLSFYWAALAVFFAVISQI